MRLYPQDVTPKTLSPLSLAFVGDSVFSLMVRERLVCEANRAANQLHKLSVTLVRAEAQAAAARQLLPLLTEEEIAVFRRGRNAHTARNSDEYHLATALEALFGWLYLRDEHTRLQELFDSAMSIINSK